MKQTMHPISVRIEWCRRQSAQARTESEIDEWFAEADGLRDALMGTDHTDNYQLCLSRSSDGTCWDFRMGRHCCEPRECSAWFMPPPRRHHNRLGWVVTFYWEMSDELPTMQRPRRQ